VPTYQYACTACGEQLEAVQSFTDPALTECPQCGGALRKVFSAVGVVFKGSGFYKTDSRAKTGAGKSEGGSSSGDTSSDGGGTKKDTAPAAKTETSSSSGTKPATSTPTAKSA
jgi:putative FmdB family regulatory protein